MRTIQWLPALISLIGVGVFYLLFQKKNYEKVQSKEKRRIALTFKGTATLFAAALAVYGTILAPETGNILLTAGLTICAAADVALGIRLLWGVAVFALGHVFYCAAYILCSPPGLPNFLVFAVLLVLALIFLFPRLKKGAGDRPLWPFVAYGAVLLFMMSLTVTQSPVLMAGAMLFVISDCMLSFRIFLNNKSVSFDYVCLGCYYLAQYLIALSILV